jgi:hypothetical protein
MKNLIMMFAFLSLVIAGNAQDEEDESNGFKKENLFTGGSLSLGFYTNGSVIGATPIFGYRVADWLDAGVAFNYIYTGERHVIQYDDRARQTVFGPGVFARLYPVNFLFVQGQFEHNFINLKYIPNNGNPNEKYKSSASSFLVGGGYAQGRDKNSNTFYYIALLFDIMREEDSPYTSIETNPNTGEQRVKAVPIIRAGFNIALFGGRY